MDQLVKPHGSDSLNPLFVTDDTQRAALLKEAEGLPKLLVCSQAAANAVMLGCGYFNPLTGYMSLADSLAVAENMKTTNGLFSIPGEQQSLFYLTPLLVMSMRLKMISHPSCRQSLN